MGGGAGVIQLKRGYGGIPTRFKLIKHGICGAQTPKLDGIGVFLIFRSVAQ